MYNVYESPVHNSPCLLAWHGCKGDNIPEAAVGWLVASVPGVVREVVITNGMYLAELATIALSLYNGLNIWKRAPRNACVALVEKAREGAVE